VTTFGIDISHVKAGLDLAKANPTFLAAKATEGATFQDDRYATFRAAADQNNLLFAAYHFLRGDSAISAQAQNVKSVLGDSGVPVIIDCERTSGMPQPDMGHVKAFKKAAEGLGLVVSTLLYLPEWYWSIIGRPDTTGWDIWQSDYGLNDGKYPGDTSDAWQTMGRKASVLQFTSKGRVTGYAGDVDLDAFIGTRDELAQKGWFLDYQEQNLPTKDDFQTWVAATPIVVDTAGTTQPLQKVLRRILTAELDDVAAPTTAQIAAAVVAALPANTNTSDLTQQQVEDAVKAALREGTG
jgi:hypothetical protein